MKPDVANIYERNELLWGKEAQELLLKKTVVVMGLGGVGAYAAESLARSGVGKLILVDFDNVADSNINRQLLALTNTVGESKVLLMKKRIEAINPHIEVLCIPQFYTKTLNSLIFSQQVDFVIDAIDSMKFKVDLIESCVELGVPIITSMGAGNRIDPCKLYIGDISEVKTSNCPFSKAIKYRLKIRGIRTGLTVVASKEKPFSTEKRMTTFSVANENGENIEVKKFIPGSSPFVPPVAGYMMAAHIVKQFIGK